MARLREWAEGLVESVREWCHGRSPWARAPLAAYLLYAGIRHLASHDYRSWFYGITLGVHELGHLLFMPFGQTLHLLGGSLMQLVAPLAAALYLLLKQRDWFGLAVGGSWLAFSTWELATYVGDANREELPLVGFDDAPLHDWATLLAQWHLINQTDTIAAAIRVVALVLWVASMALGSWTLWLMWRAQRAATSPKR